MAFIQKQYFQTIYPSQRHNLPRPLKIITFLKSRDFQNFPQKSISSRKFTNPPVGRRHLCDEFQKFQLFPEIWVYTVYLT